MASSAPAVVAATDFLMILLSPKRHLEKEKREVSRTREAQALLPPVQPSQHELQHTTCCRLSESAQGNRGACGLYLSTILTRLLC
jgi:hypothetical protein